MPIKTILVPLADAEGAQNTLAAAFALGQKFGATVDVLHLRSDPTDAIGDFVGETVSPQLIEQVLTQAEKRGTATAAQARKAYDAAAIKVTGVKTTYSQAKSRNDLTVETRGRLTDLIVVRRARNSKDVIARITAEAALMGTGRPVLVIPAKASAKTGSNIAIAWNGSLEASKAVGAALPFLTRADKVTVISANDGSGIDQKGIIRYLGRHGIKAKAVTVKAGADTGRAIVNATGRTGADLLVMGAYTHSRVREMIFGGVTEHALASARLPVLMVH